MVGLGINHSPCQVWGRWYDQGMNALELTLLYLLAAVLGVVGCRMLRLPPMLGYLAVGVLIGPNALALAHRSSGIEHLAEFGVVFLMFVIGLEFSLSKLKSMRTLVFGLGSSQVVLTMLVAAPLAGWLSDRVRPSLLGIAGIGDQVIHRGHPNLWMLLSLRHACSYNDLRKGRL